MKKVVELYFLADQYAEYLILQAESWKMHFISESLLLIGKRLLDKYKQFMDMYVLLMNNCNAGIAMYTYHSKKRRF